MEFNLNKWEKRYNHLCIYKVVNYGTIAFIKAFHIEFFMKQNILQHEFISGEIFNKFTLCPVK